MTKCEGCNQIKFDFQFPSENYGGLATMIYPICNHCIKIRTAKSILEIIRNH